MLFEICRVTGGNKTPPCKNAAVIDEKTKGWYQYKRFGIEINTLEELLEIAKLGPNGIIIEKSLGDKLLNGKVEPEYLITIYDGYIE